MIKWFWKTCLFEIDKVGYCISISLDLTSPICLYIEFLKILFVTSSIYAKSLYLTKGSTRDSTGVDDSLVNQLLTKIDGVESLNNVLLIGMTNRKDLIDETLLRPGRLEVQIEISLPDENGRVQILQIHTKKMKESSFLAPNVNLEEIVARTKNYSGAELEVVVKSAVSFALNRQLSLDEESTKVTMGDFRCALLDIVPAFGACTDDLESIVKDMSADVYFSLLKALAMLNSAS